MVSPLIPWYARGCFTSSAHWQPTRRRLHSSIAQRATCHVTTARSPPALIASPWQRSVAHRASALVASTAMASPLIPRRGSSYHLPWYHRSAHRLSRDHSSLHHRSLHRLRSNGSSLERPAFWSQLKWCRERTSLQVGRVEVRTCLRSPVTPLVASPLVASPLSSFGFFEGLIDDHDDDIVSVGRLKVLLGYSLQNAGVRTESLLVRQTVTSKLSDQSTDSPSLVYTRCTS